MRTIARTLTILVALSSQHVAAQVHQVFNGVQLLDSVESVAEKLEPHCTELDRITVESPSFPMASEVEEHLICVGFSIYDGFIELDEASFTFADDALQLIEARGDAVRSVFADNTLHDRYRVYAGPDIKVIEMNTDSIWFLNDEGMHTNLYAWSNPYLPTNSSATKHYQSSAKIPAVFRFGSAREEMMDEFQDACRFVSVQEFSPSNSQVNCFGIEYAGFPRKIEARFGDNGLELLWILTAKGEESRVASSLAEAFGDPVYESTEWTVFKNWEVSLRKDKPEVLVLTPEGAEAHKQSLLAGPAAGN